MIDMDQVAIWIGYCAMLIGGLVVVVALLSLVAILLNSSIGLMGKYLLFRWDLETVKKVMRDLEAEGKIQPRGKSK
ncbi:MAG: hypothetical protein J6A65_06860 [Pseudomonas sp.]|nr:hypothetical protein [Pseudomonas sp.]MBP3934473.1 hypothetical protein [Pseudomonas sp.]